MFEYKVGMEVICGTKTAEIVLIGDVKEDNTRQYVVRYSNGVLEVRTGKAIRPTAEEFDNYVNDLEKENEELNYEVTKLNTYIAELHRTIELLEKGELK